MLHLQGQAQKNTSDVNFQYFPTKTGERGASHYSVKLINIYASQIDREIETQEDHVLNVTLKVDFQGYHSNHNISKPFSISVKRFNTRIASAETLMRKKLGGLIVVPRLEYSTETGLYAVHLPPKSGIYATNIYLFQTLGFNLEFQTVRNNAAGVATHWGIKNEGDSHVKIYAEETRGLNTILKDWLFFGETEENLKVHLAFATTPTVILVYILEGDMEKTVILPVTDITDISLIAFVFGKALGELFKSLNVKKSLFKVTVAKVQEKKKITLEVVHVKFAQHLELELDIDLDTQHILHFPRTAWTFKMGESDENEYLALNVIGREFPVEEPYLLENKMEHYTPFLILATGYKTNSFITGRGSVCSLAFVDDDRVINSNRLILSSKGGTLNISFLTPDFKDIIFKSDLDVFLHLKSV